MYLLFTTKSYILLAVDICCCYQHSFSLLSNVRRHLFSLVLYYVHEIFSVTILVLLPSTSSPFSPSGGRVTYLIGEFWCSGWAPFPLLMHLSVCRKGSVLLLVINLLGTGPCGRLHVCDGAYSSSSEISKSTWLTDLNSCNKGNLLVPIWLLGPSTGFKGGALSLLKPQQ